MKTKKYRVYLSNGKHVDFGARGYEQFRDSTPLRAFSDYDHNDVLRRQRYYQRHNINYPKFSADYMSKRYLW